MERYSNRRGNSPITYFQIENDRIIVKFKDGKSYTYSHFKVGSHHVEQMKSLARAGSGLCAYINQNVRFKYD